MSTEEGFDIPEDIVLNILCRLPFKSLIRFSCVFKRWRFIIISDPQFAKSHLQLASQRRTLTQRLFVTIYPAVFKNNGRFGDRLIPQFQSWKDSLNGSVINLNFPTEEQNDIQVITSCNGLVLLGDSYMTDLVHLSIWNPSTGFFRKIPSPRITNDTYLEFVISGFGYVSATDDYRLVFVIPGDMTHFLVYIFSLKENCWRVIEAPQFSSYSSRFYRRHEVGIFSNGAIHWINRNSISQKRIYAFDLAEEEFREIPMPGWFPIPPNVGLLLGGCLCLGFKMVDTRSCEILGMTEYAVPESWVKLFRFTEYDVPDVFASMYYGWHGLWDLCFVTEGGTIVINLIYTNELVRIECRKDEKPVCSGRYQYHLEKVPGIRHYCRTLYVETLVSVPE